MNVKPISKAANRPPGTDLEDLLDLPLTDENRRRLDEACAHMAGDAHWATRRRHELHKAMALTQVTGRVRPLFIDATDELRIALAMHVTVPTMRSGELLVADHAIIELRYPQDVMTQNLPGTAFLRIAQPRGVWLANACPITGALCVGTEDTMRNISVVELIWLAYSALTLQVHMYDERDPARVINGEAARWWQVNQRHIPLTDEPLIPRAH